MEVTDKIIKFRIKPYVQEAVLQFVIDIIVIFLVTALFIITEIPMIVCVLIDLVYLIVALIFHYKVVIQAIIDMRKHDYIADTISIKQFNEEYSFAGDRFGHGYIRFFYPKEMQVGKYKLKVINDNGESKKFRTVMSFRRLHKFGVFHKHQIEYLNVTYLKSSKIIISFDLIEDADKITSKRKKEEIEKAIHHINMSI